MSSTTLIARFVLVFVEYCILSKTKHLELEARIMLGDTELTERWVSDADRVLHIGIAQENFPGTKVPRCGKPVHLWRKPIGCWDGPIVGKYRLCPDCVAREYK